MNDLPTSLPGPKSMGDLLTAPPDQVRMMALLIAQQRFGDAAVHGCRTCHRYRVSASFVEDTLLALQHSGQHRSAIEIAMEILPQMPEANRPFLRATIAILAAQLGWFEFSLQELHKLWPGWGGFDPLVDPDIQCLWDHLAAGSLTKTEAGLLMSQHWEKTIPLRETAEQESLVIEVSAMPSMHPEIGRWLVWVPQKVLWKLDEYAPDHTQQWLREAKHETRKRNQHVLDSVRVCVLSAVSS